MYSREVREKFFNLLSAFMKSYSICQSMINDIYTSKIPLFKTIEDMETLIDEFKEKHFLKNFKTNHTIIHDFFTQMYDIIKNDKVFKKKGNYYDELEDITDYNENVIEHQQSLNFKRIFADDIYNLIINFPEQETINMFYDVFTAIISDKYDDYIRKIKDEEYKIKLFNAKQGYMCNEKLSQSEIKMLKKVHFI
jgi:organic radical activating enzyme